MIKCLEKYACHPEEQVVERALQLYEEKVKVDNLLQELLPASVAKSLVADKQVQPETFNNVSIFLSDIVGFTSISATASPMEIVIMLNDMYTLFDDVIHMFDVYKVATIGDAYMVASGVPERNGDQHAPEICNMALELLKAIQTFCIPHKPGKSLKMRIGIHSGPCVAGVVGIKMPRYFLFGDTVDIAGKMESGGMVMKIHVSESTQKLAQLQHTNLLFTERGMFNIKGVPGMLTFWLKEY